MFSEVEICRLALGNLGEQAQLDSLDERTPVAEACKLHYRVALSVALTAHLWSFASHETGLAPLAGNVSNWSGMFAVPTGTLRVWGLRERGGGGQVPYDTSLAPDGSARVILTNAAQPVMLRSLMQIDPGTYSAPFVDAFSWLLASYLAGPIVRGESGRQAAGTAYKTGLARLEIAAGIDANQSHSREYMDFAPSSITARGGY